MRSFRSSLLQLISYMAKPPGCAGSLVLIEPGVSKHRLLDEWEKARHALKDALAARLNILISRRGELKAVVGEVDEAVEAAIDQQLQRGMVDQAGAPLGQPDYTFEILKVLLVRRLHQEKPISTKELIAIVGCSYPTAAKALERLAPHISRHTKKSILLDRFPRRLWSEMLVRGDRLRSTRRFIDRSGQPRSFASLGRRPRRPIGVADTDPPVVALGGMGYSARCQGARRREG